MGLKPAINGFRVSCENVLILQSCIFAANHCKTLSDFWRLAVWNNLHLFPLKLKLDCLKNNSISWKLGCKNIRFSSLFATGDVSRGGTSATQQQKFHTDHANQCLHNKSRSDGVPKISMSNFKFLLVDFVKCCVYLLRSSSKTQMLLLEKTLFHKRWLFC